MKSLLLSITFLALIQTVGFAQKFNGDWKGKIVYDSPQGYTEEFIFHIVDDECSEELTRRSSSDAKEALIKMSIDGDTIILEMRKKGKFEGTLKNGKIVGTCTKGSKVFDMTLTKFGKGEITVQSNYKKDKKNGIVVY